MGQKKDRSFDEGIWRELRADFRGELRTDPLSRSLYSTDASSYLIEPRGVAFPADARDVVTAVEWAAQAGIALIPRGGGTSLSGQGIGEGLILDTTPHLNHILEINTAERWARVEAGVLLDQLNAAVKSSGLMVGPDPSSAPMATIGGMTANNSTGSHSILYGMMIDHVLEVEVVCSDGRMVRFVPQSPAAVTQLSRADTVEGRLYREVPRLLENYEGAIEAGYPATWRNVAGYNLNRLLRDKRAGKPLNLTPLIVGSEGTLAAILNVKVRLVPRPLHTHLVLLHYDDLHEALSAVPAILEHQPGAIELLDKFFIDLTRRNVEYRNRLEFIEGDPRAVLIVEFAGDQENALQQQSAALLDELRERGFRGAAVKRQHPEAVRNVWEVRKAGLGLLLSMRGDAKPLAFIDDAAVPVEHLADYAEQVMSICRKAGTEAGFYAHASAGCLHINPLINLKTEQGIEQLEKISRAVIDLAIGYRGTSTGEHGEGLARSYYNELLYGTELHRAFRELKGVFDPLNLFNPGKIVAAPLPWDPHLLRFNPRYQTPQTFAETHLDFSAAGGFSGLVEMCNGQGVCRKIDSGVMCPSYMATREEAYSTRGRANALRAAMTGKLGARGMDDPALYDALDLCLGCKACKHECPSLVDMAKLKYEFLAQYQERNGVSRPSRLFGHIAAVNRLASRFPKLANAGLTNASLKRLLERFLGIDARRSLPSLASRTFRQWFRRRDAVSGGPRGAVILWDDTFLLYNEPQIGIAAVQVLETLGFEVRILAGRRCCGRPMISRGLLKEARRAAAHNVELLLPYVQKGLPVIGLEPSCILTFREEYLDLLGTAAARQVAEQCFFIEEFLTQATQSGTIAWPWPENLPSRRILVHGHCYQKASIGTAPLLQMLRLIPNAVVEEIPSGCCGMAGAFGYETKHYEVSMQCGEDRLFPAVRQAAADTAIAASGTSCRHQILDGTGRTAEHPIELMAGALAWGGGEKGE